MTPRPPTHLQLWHFDAPVVPIDVVDGRLTPPPDPRLLGWWGAPAGAEHGTTVLTGHTVHTGGGEFDDLEDVPLGSRGEVSGASYTVTSVEVITKATLAQRAPQLFDQTGRAKLVLITCEDYDPSTGEYDSNVVVTLTPS